MPAMSPYAMKLAVAAAKRAAKNKAVQGAAASAGLWVAKKVGESATKVGAGKAARRKDRRSAYAFARQVSGQYSEGTFIANRERMVVWKGEKAIACFAPLTAAELNGTKLCDREELQDFNQSLLKDPPPLKRGS